MATKQRLEQKIQKAQATQGVISHENMIKKLKQTVLHRDSNTLTLEKLQRREVVRIY